MVIKMSKSEIRFNGNPKLYIDGKQTAPVIYALSDFPAAGSGTAYAQKNIKNFSDIGIKLVNIDTELRTGWHKTTPFEPDAMLSEIANVLDAEPDAKVNIRLHINPPYWWMRDNPSELAVYRMPNGDVPGIDDGEPDRLIGHDGDDHMRVSLASEKWISDTARVLSELLEYYAESDEGNAIFGIQIACGLFGEWHKWGSGEDVSPAMQKRFKRFLREKYITEDALRAAWNDSFVTFENAEYHPERFAPGDDGMFRDPQKSRVRMDSVECAQAVPADDILYFSKLVKDKLPNVLVGAFYGYYLWTGGDHLQVKRIYDSGIVDFLCAPFCYDENRKPFGVPMQRGLLESSRLNKMLWLTEMDQCPEGATMLGKGDPEQFPSTIAILRRNVLQVLATGHGLWYYDHRVIPLSLAGSNDKRTSKNSGSIYRKRGWWEEAELMNEISELQRIAEKLSDDEYSPVADVLMVYDTSSFYCRADFKDPDYKLYEAVGRCGVSFDCIYADDLDKAELERYKCVIFTNAYMLTPEKRTKIRELLKNTVTVWLGVQGYCDGNTLSEKNLSETVGIALCRAEFGNENRPIKGVGLLEGTEHAFPDKAPVFKACDADAEILGYYSDGSVAAAKKGNDIWLSSNGLNRDEIFKILNYSGAHIWCGSGEPIFACGSFVVINSPSGGKRTIIFPNKITVECELPEYTTAVFDIKTGKRVL